MPLTRRAMLGLTLAGALYPLAGPAKAQRFVNRTGLKPGRFIWEPAKSAEGPVLIIVSLGERITHVYRGGAAIGISTCSTGWRGHRTPTGVFTIREQARRPAASRSNGGRMPARERLTWSGIALHAHDVWGYPVSFGCVRLPLEFSALLFDVTHPGTTVIIAEEHTQAGEVIEPGTLFPVLAEEEGRPKDHAGGERIERMDKSPVVSVLVSGADAKAVVMRDGVVESETRVTIHEPQKKLGTHVYSLLGADATGNAMRWLTFGTAHEKNAAHLTTWQAPDPLNRIAFAQSDWALAAARAMHVGTTLTITDAAAPPITRRTPANFVIVASPAPEPRRRPPARRPQRPREDHNDRDDRDDGDEATSLHPVSPR